MAGRPRTALDHGPDDGPLGPESPDPGAQPASPIGRRAFIAGTAGALVGVATSGAVAHAVEPGASFFEAQSARRLCDTRHGLGYTDLGNNTIRVRIGGNGGIPADAVAAVFTLTCTDNGTPGNYATAYPSGTSRPDTSNLNLNTGESTVANLVTVRLGTGGVKGYVDIFTYAPCNVLVDIAGVYRPTATEVPGGRLVTIDPMVRVVDTRGSAMPAAGSTYQVNLNGRVPSDAVAVVANLTSVGADNWGYLTAFARGGSRPDASNLNVAPGDVRAVGIMTKLGSAGGVRGFNVFTSIGTHILVDVVGFITGPSGDEGNGVVGSSSSGLFVPINPTRTLDTRVDKRRLWPGWTRAFPLPGSFRFNARAVAMNVTVVDARLPGYVTVHAAQRTRYVVSNLNASRSGQTVANHVVSAASTAGVATFSEQGSHMIADVTGWFTGGAAAIQQLQPPADPPPPPAPLPWTLQVDRLGLKHGVYGGSPNPIVNSGSTWHWTGTPLIGEGGNMAMFAHRTDAGGPYRNLHWLVPGDRLQIWTNDNRLYTYEYVQKHLASKYANNILEQTRKVNGDTVAMIACTVGYDRTKAAYPNAWAPTSLEYRIVSLFRLVSWTDLG